MSDENAVTIEELMAKLNKDPNYVKMMKERDAEAERNRREFEQLETPVLADLHRVGILVPSIGNAAYFEKYLPLSDEPVAVLLKWLPKVHPRLQECIVRLLAAARKNSYDGTVLVEFFDQNGSSHLRWLIGNTLALTTPQNITGWLELKVRDPLVGDSKPLLLTTYFAVAERDAVVRLAKEFFDEFPIECAEALAKIGASSELAFLKTKLSSCSPNAQKRVRRAIREIERNCTC